eukprot:9499351-Pyramimonas_sp.AAC.1
MLRVAVAAQIHIAGLSPSRTTGDIDCATPPPPRPANAGRALSPYAETGDDDGSSKRPKPQATEYGGRSEAQTRRPGKPS